MKKNIYVAYTGGTIGMKESTKESIKGYVPVKGHLIDAIQALPDFFRPEMPAFTINEYSNLIDSANMSPSDWQIIAEDIFSHYDQYDGFVILQGTDTMAYTSSALSFMFENLSKPIIVTGSQIPLSHLRSDGQFNFLNSLYVAANYPVNEVGLFFNNMLFRGNRSVKVSAEGFGAFDSPNMPPLLETGIKVRLIEGEIDSICQGELNLRQITHQNIAVIHFYPGISGEFIESVLKQDVRALILRSYGTGNAPQNKAILDCLYQACQQNIVVVNCSQCIKGSVNMSGYATGSALSECGVISGQDMTFESTLTKLHFLLSQNYCYEEVCRLMQKNIRGELSF